MDGEPQVALTEVRRLTPFPTPPGCGPTVPVVAHVETHTAIGLPIGPTVLPFSVATIMDRDYAEARTRPSDCRTVDELRADVERTNARMHLEIEAAAAEAAQMAREAVR